MKITCFLRTLVTFILFASGCAPTSISSRSGDPPSDDDQTFPVHGMPYYLPIGAILIKGEYKAPPATATTGKTSAEPAAHSEKADAAQPSAVGNTFGLLQLAVAADTPPEKADPKPASGDSTTNSVTLAVGGWTITLSAGIEADAQRKFYALPRRNYVFEDEYKIGVNGKHLLSTGNSVADDRTAAIIGEVASIVSQGIPKAARPASPDASTAPFLVSFRTNNRKEFEIARAVLEKRQIDLRMSPAPSDVAPPEKGFRLERGLVFRLAEAYRVTLQYPNRRATDGDLLLNYSHNFLLPGLQPYVIAYERMPFVKKTIDVGFEDGMLASYHEKVPSPVLGVLGIPKAIVGAVVPLLGGGSLGGSAPSSTTAAPTP